jgi:Leucine-rich repeat (LRR) protein
VWKLPELQELDLSDCRGFTTMSAGPLAEHNSKLQKLVMAMCTRLCSMPVELEQLIGLKVLNLEGCSKLEVPAAVWQLPELQELDLGSCESLTIPPALAGFRCSKLQKLTLRNWTNLHSLPAGLAQLTVLKALDLGGCHNLQDTHSVWQLSSLEELDLTHSGTHDTMPQQLGQFASVRVLRLKGWDVLTEVPAAIWPLPNLHELDLSNCRNLTALTPAAELGSSSISSSSTSSSSHHGSSSIGSGLTRLALRDCTSLCRFLAESTQLSKLQELDLSGCISLHELPVVCELADLRKLDLHGCSSLPTLPADIGRLGSLQLLVLHQCTGLQELPASIGGLSSLQELKLSGCSSLQSLPASISSLRHISELQISGCNALQHIPSLAGMSMLTSLEILYCSKLEAMPEGLHKLPALEALMMISCSALAVWPEFSSDTVGPSKVTEWIGGRDPTEPKALVSLKRLWLVRCPRLTRLPYSLGSAQSLQRLHVQGCNALEELPRTLGNLVNLTELQVLECSKLKSLPDTIWNMRLLKALEVRYCDVLTALPDIAAEQTLPSLVCLQMVGCGLAHLPEFVGRLSSLTALDLSHCSNLESLPWQMQGNSQLSGLDVSHCSKLAKLPETLPASLQSLSLSYCREVMSLGEWLVRSAPQMGDAKVYLHGWEYLLAKHLGQQPNALAQLTLELSDPVWSSSILAALKKATVIETLLADEISLCARPPDQALMALDAAGFSSLCCWQSTTGWLESGWLSWMQQQRQRERHRYLPS